jgi:hypothetical protein
MRFTFLALLTLFSIALSVCAEGEPELAASSEKLRVCPIRVVKPLGDNGTRGGCLWDTSG